MTEHLYVTSTAAFRAYLRVADQIANQFGDGQISEREAIVLQEGAQRELDRILTENYMRRLDAMRFFRDPVPDHVGDAVPVSPADGR